MGSTFPLRRDGRQAMYSVPRRTHWVHDTPPISVSSSLAGLVTTGGSTSLTPLTMGGAWTMSGTSADSDAGGTDCDAAAAASPIWTSFSATELDGSGTSVGVGWEGSGKMGAGTGDVAGSAGIGCSSGFGSSNLLTNLSRMFVRSGFPSYSIDW